MLELNNVYKTFNLGTINEKKALNGVNLKLEDGDFVTVIGGNGAGKSTTLNAVAGVWPIDSGSIIIDGVDMTGLSEHKEHLILAGYSRSDERDSGDNGNYRKSCSCGKKRTAQRS